MELLGGNLGFVTVCLLEFWPPIEISMTTSKALNSRYILFLTYCVAMTITTACNAPFTRPQPQFEIVESVDVQTEGLLDFGLEVRAKIHNFGAAGSPKGHILRIHGVFRSTIKSRKCAQLE